MSRFSPIFWGKWTRKAAGIPLRTITTIVFLVLDLLDAIFCILYKFLDEFFEGNASQCYCKFNASSDGGVEDVSETLYERRNVFRKSGILGLPRKLEDDGDEKRNGRIVANRWSDCGCESCISWQRNGDQRLYVVTKNVSEATIEDCRGTPSENVIFIHGFLSSSSLWTETVFPNLSEPIYHNYKLFAMDILGFGRSPKPKDCLYTLKDHLEMIERSVIHPFHLNSFHLVAHSMGCILALAVAAKYPKSVKSITLIAPPYFPSSKDNIASLTVLGRVAEKKLWPLMMFGSSVMSWYEHLGRCICFLVCRNHRIWEWIIKLLTRRRDLHFMIEDLSRHTHHSAWHTMHNVICGGAKYVDDYLRILNESGLKINVMQGDKDQVVPLECSNNIKLKYPVATEVNIIRNADHHNVILGREKCLIQDLEHIWVSSSTRLIYLSNKVRRQENRKTQVVCSVLLGNITTDNDSNVDDSKAIVVYNLNAMQNTYDSNANINGLVVEEDDEKYPDLRHSLFDLDEDGEEVVGGSVIDLVRNSKEEGEEFSLEDEIDQVADFFIKRFHRQMRLQK